MKIRGVNLGNWLVLEKWMEPDMFEGCDAEDETWLNRMLPEDELRSRMKKHRDSYITEDDFKKIKGMGLNLVRIPVPYFIFGDKPPFIGCIEYLDLAFEWAKKYDLKILIDLHTAPGNQNGYDNGGIVGVCKWHKNKYNVYFVISVLERLAKRYAKRKALFGIEVLNEPISWPVYKTAPTTGKAKDPEESKGSGYVPMSFLTKFYEVCYRRLRKILPANKAIVFHDGFRMSLWNAFFARNAMENVYLDVHVYVSAMESFTKAKKPIFYKAYLAMDKQRIRLAAKNIPVIVGEWCISNSYANDLEQNDMNSNLYANEKARRYREVADMELDAWMYASGWIYWSYKLRANRGREAYLQDSWKESWDFQRCVENRWFPADRIKE